MDTTDEINRGELLLKVGILLFVKLFCTVCVLVQIYKKIRFVRSMLVANCTDPKLCFVTKKKLRKGTLKIVKKRAKTDIPIYDARFRTR